MSSPATPLAPGAADAVPPVERERYWWTPLALAIDRWLQPRWRALSTWVVAALLTGLVGDSQILNSALAEASSWLVEQATDLYGELFSYRAAFWRKRTIRLLIEISGAVLLFSWFQPLVLRLGIRRTLAWMVIAVLVGFIVATTTPTGGVVDLLIFGLWAGIPGLVAIGRRSRPWMSLPAGAMAIGALVALRPDPQLLTTPLLVSNFIYGAVMLYGTSPLPRKEAAR